ncbi:MAG: cytochrome c3 family protein [Nitrospirota bacterium]
MVTVQKKKNALFLVTLVVLAIFFSPALLLSEGQKIRSHADKNKLPKGCASCHKGHGKYNTPMLAETKETFCFRCHGSTLDVEKTRQQGDLARDTKASDIMREFEKPYRHPVEKMGIHRYGEILPETDPSLPRHSECVDCHHHHLVLNDNKMAGMKGTNAQGMLMTRASSEYEICFNCHSFSANLPAGQSNKAELFDVSNPSYHPVIAPGKNGEITSLMPPYTLSSTIKCTDCHNNDEPQGPNGPHGSIYKYILTRNFTSSDGAESSLQYELCYSCHRRSSVLGDESFPYHNLHVAIVGTSCRTCHNPHGSRQYTHLVDLDNLTIRPSTTSGRLEFIDLGLKTGQCYLSCHDKDHGPAIYPAQPSEPLPASGTGSSTYRRYRR